MTQTSIPFAAIAPGVRRSHSYTITPSVYEQFLALFQDTNRLHVEDEYARSHGFEARVAHGAILNGFISHFVGVCFPGDGSLLHSVHMQYKSPCYVGDEIELNAEVSQTVEALRVLVLEITLTNRAQGRVAAKARVQVGCL